MSVVIPEKFAIMAVDPGETTGVATGLFNAGRAGTSVAGLLRRAARKGAINVDQIEGGGDYPETAQAWRLYKMWNEFNFNAHVEMGVGIPHILLVIEDFQLRQRSADLSPIRVTWGFLALLKGESGAWAALSLGTSRLIFQGPSEAMTFATKDRLEKWGLWTVGKEHGRDATKHLALRASKVLGG